MRAVHLALVFLLALANGACTGDDVGSPQTACVSAEDCNDSLFCNGEESCVDGECVPGPIPAGLDDGVGCTVDACDEDSDTFTHTPSNAACDDGLFCNGDETCNAALGCEEGTAPVDDDGIDCTIERCDEAVDQIVHEADDGLCGDSDSCTRGHCSPTNGCEYANTCTCTDASDCDDGNPCTDDLCQAGACTYRNNNADCDDGLFCNGADTCSEGACVHAGDPCVDGGECSNQCDERADACAVPDDTPCADDGNQCTANICREGVCTGVAIEGSCDDGIFCNGVDSCRAGQCVQHSGDPCVEECRQSCNENAATCDPQPGEPCTDDGNECTDDVCDESGTCAHSNNKAPCDDGLFCNGLDSCLDGACSAHTGDPCTGGGECADVCDETRALCGAVPSTPCGDDGDNCTDDVCNDGGWCTHSPSTVCAGSLVTYVDHAATGANDGRSWGNAFSSLQDALSATTEGEIWVAAGTYVPDVGVGIEDDDPVATFHLRAGVALYGGFAGTETSRSQRDWRENATVLSGQIAARSSGPRSYHVVTAQDLGVGTVVDGFTITMGQANLPDEHDNGGGMFIWSSEVWVENCRFVGNSASTTGLNSRAGGGAMFSMWSDTTVINCHFENNSASGRQKNSSGVGGAILTGGTMRIIHSTFDSNHAYITGRTNLADAHGGAVANGAGEIHVLNSSFRNNSVSVANREKCKGGAVYSWGGEVRVMGSLFADNEARCGGGGEGGALFFEGWGTQDVINNTFAGNHSDRRGAVTSYDAQQYNNAFWGNTPVDISCPPSSCTDARAEYNCLEHRTYGANNLLLTEDPFLPDYTLREGSPCIDAGDNARVPADAFDLDSDGDISELTPLDRSRRPRFADGVEADTGSGSAPIVDCGAHEAF